MRPIKRTAQRVVCGLTAACVLFTPAAPALAGGYTFDLFSLTPSLADFNWSFTSPVDFALPTFDNRFFNDINLVSVINNDFIRTPSTLDPVSTVSGNNYRDETDFNIKGRNGLNYVFTRTYNSESRNKQRGLGFGWSHSYGMTLRSNDFGKWPNCQNNATKCAENNDAKTSSITYTDERGGDHNYLVSAAGQVSPPIGEFESLQLNTPSVGKHTLQFRNGNRYVFETVNAQGNASTAAADYLHLVPGRTARLIYIYNPWGDRLALDYDTSGRLKMVTDNLGIAGRTGLTFTYHTDGVLKDVSDWTGRLWRYDYASGEMNAVTSPMGVLVRYGYDSGPAAHFLKTVTRPGTVGGVARTTYFEPYVNGRTFTQTNADGSGDTLDYDLFRRTTRVTNARGDVREFVYDQFGGMTRLAEADGGVHLFENQADTLRFKKTDPQGYSTSYSYRADRTIGATLASDTGGMVTRERDALDQTFDTAYGPLGQPSAIKDKRGNESRATFFVSTGPNVGWVKDKIAHRIIGRLTLATTDVRTNVYTKTSFWNPDGTLWYEDEQLSPDFNTHRRVTSYEYQAGTNNLNISAIEVQGFNQASQPTTSAVRRTYTYDALGRMKSETLKRRKSPTDASLIDITTSYDYDALDRVIKVTDNAGNFTRYLYNDNFLTRVEQNLKKPDGTFEVRNVITYGRDAADKVITETDAAGKVTTYSYDRAGNVLSVKDPLGHVTQYEYDSAGRKTAVVDATGYRTTMAYDLRGNVVSVTNANSETTTLQYDALGRLTDTVDARGYRTRRGYDANGNLICLIDANAEAGLQRKNSQGCTTEYRYDELNRLVKVVDAKDGETDFTYDLIGNRLTVTDAARKVWKFNYDDLGRLSGEVDHSGKATSYKRDEAGNLYEKTDRNGAVTRYTYDSLNRLQYVDDVQTGVRENFGYDIAGNLNAASNPNASYGFTYDTLNRLKTKTDARGRSLSFTYDDAGNLRTKTTFQGTTTTYQYNAANRLVQLRNPEYLQVDYQYDQAGRLRGRVMSSGARSIYNYDANGWLSDLAHYDAKGAAVASSSFTRDRLGNVLSQVDTSGALPGTRSYGYDALYRLETSDLPGTANDELFSYDKVGNRLTATKGALVAGPTTRYYIYTPGTNRLAELRQGSTTGPQLMSFSYDDEGRMQSSFDHVTSANSRIMLWDAKGRMTSLTKAGKTENYRYDPTNHRIARLGGALGNLDYFLEGEHLESVYSGGQVQAKYFRGGSIDELVAAYSYEGGKLKPQFFLQDATTSTSAIGGHNGGVTQALAYSPFGTVLASSGSSANRLRYTGREDDGTGLYYYRARYYDPALGRFISEDPKGFYAGINFYAYAEGNPVNANDPYGEEVVINRSGPGLKTLDVQYNKVLVYAGPRDPADVAKDMAGVEKSLSGRFPPYTVTTSINWQFTDNVSQAMKDPTAIVVQYMSLEYLGAARSDSGAFLGYIPAQQIPAYGGLSSTLQFGTAAAILDKSHEFGHEGGMAGFKHLGVNGFPLPPTDAMAAVPNRDATFSGQDFTAMLWTAANIVNPPMNPAPPAAAAGSPSRVTTFPSALSFDYLDAVYRK